MTSDLIRTALAALNQPATVIAAAPGRVNLIGEHIDYCDGFVMPFAIDRSIVIAAALRDGTTATFRSAGLPDAVIDVQSTQQIGEPSWANYLRGVIDGFQQLGHTIPGFDAQIVSSVPGGAGLSSSAALECATATLLEGLLGISLTKKQKALLCQTAEHDFAKVPCGIMDQFASVFGEENRIVMIDCQSEEPTLLPFENPNLSVIIANTNVHHQLTDGGYALRRHHTEEALAKLQHASWRTVTMADVEAKWDELGDPVNRRARHVVTEIARTQAAAEALAANDFATLGTLMHASHVSLRDDFEVSCDELDLMVTIANDIGERGGVRGARMTGGGFGGSTVTLCDSDQAESIMATMRMRYQTTTNIAPEIFCSRPARGAHLLPVEPDPENLASGLTRAS
jgi:galactokinase